MLLLAHASVAVTITTVVTAVVLAYLGVAADIMLAAVQVLLLLPVLLSLWFATLCLCFPSDVSALHCLSCTAVDACAASCLTGDVAGLQ